jgi:hypothetical protein
MRKKVMMMMKVMMSLTTLNDLLGKFARLGFTASFAHVLSPVLYKCLSHLPRHITTIRCLLPFLVAPDLGTDNSSEIASLPPSDASSYILPTSATT